MSKLSLPTSQSAGNINQLAKTIKTLAILSSSISHELKNDLAAISFCAEAVLLNIRKKVEAANFFMDNLLLQIKSVTAGKLNKDDFRACSITKNIKEVLEQYPFQNGERLLITMVTANDFEYIGNPILTNHILSNLIKNSLRAIKNADKGKITITLELGKKFNKLIFKDTAAGISKSFLPKIFELFESQSQGGTGIGLAFCKYVMNSYGGDMICQSTEGIYTEFYLEFPSI